MAHFKKYSPNFAPQCLGKKYLAVLYMLPVSVKIRLNKCNCKNKPDFEPTTTCKNEQKFLFKIQFLCVLLKCKKRTAFICLSPRI